MSSFSPELIKFFESVLDRDYKYAFVRNFKSFPADLPVKISFKNINESPKGFS